MIPRRYAAAGLPLVLLLLALLTGSERASVGSAAQAAATPLPILATPSASTAGWTRLVAAADDVAWVVQRQRLTALDLRSSPPVAFAPPLSFPSSNPPFEPIIHDVAAAPGGLVLVVVDDTLHVLDGSDPRAPVRLATLQPADGIAKVVIEGTVAYLLVLGPGDDPASVIDVMVVDLAEPSAPRIARERLLPAGAPVLGTLAVGGGVLAMVLPAGSIPGTAVGVVRLFDLSDPLAPRAAARLEDTALGHVVVGMRGGFPTLVGASGGDVAIFDLTDPDSPRATLRLGENDLPGDVRFIAGLAMTDDGAIYVSAPRYLGSFYTGGQVFRVSAAGGDPWEYTAARPFLGPIAGDGRRLLLAEEVGLRVLDPRAETASLWPAVRESTWVAAMSGEGDGAAPRVLSIAAIGGIFSLEDDGRDMLSPRWVLSDWKKRGRVSADGGWVVATNAGVGDVIDQALDTFRMDGDVLEPIGSLDLRSVGSVDLRTFAHQARRLVLPGRGGRLALYEIATSGDPVGVDEAAVDGRLTDVAIDGPAVAVVGYAQSAPNRGEQAEVWLQAYRIEGQTGPEQRLVRRGSVVVERRAIGSWSEPGVAVEGDHAFVTLRSGCVNAERTELHVIDLSDPDSPRRIAGMELPDTARQPVVERGMLLLAGSAVHVVDVRQPQAPRLLGRLVAPNPMVLAVDAADGVVYAAGREGWDGVHAFTVALPWRDAASVPSPTPPDILTPGPSPSPTAHAPCPTATSTPTRQATVGTPPAPRTQTSTVTPTATPTPSFGTPTRSPLYLPQALR